MYYCRYGSNVVRGRRCAHGGVDSFAGLGWRASDWVTRCVVAWSLSYDVHWGMRVSERARKGLSAPCNKIGSQASKPFMNHSFVISASP
jgi:hypothetical protein